MSFHDIIMMPTDDDAPRGYPITCSHSRHWYFYSSFVPTTMSFESYIIKGEY
jgi:hypothetical protein